MRLPFYMVVKVLSRFTSTALVLLGVAFGACQEQETSLPRNDAPILKAVGERTFDFSSAPGIVHDEILTFRLPDRRVLGAVDENDQSLLLYDYLDGVLIRDVPIGQKVKSDLGIAEVFINGFFVASMDSIFALLNPQNVLLLFDTSGTIKQYWKVDEVRANGHSYGLLASLNQSPLLWSDGRLLVAQQLNGGGFARDPERRRLKFSSAPDVELSLDSDTVMLHEVGTFPPKMLGDFYYDVIGARTVGPHGEVVYAYGVSDSIYVWRRSSPLAAVAARSEYRRHGFDPFDTARYQDVAYIKTYWAIQPRYGNILFDPWRKCYYRFFAHSQDQKADDGLVNLFKDKPWSVIVLDEDFRIVGEQAFSAKEYFFPNAIVTEEGLLIEVAGSSETEQNVIRYRVFQRVAEGESEEARGVN